MSNANTKTEKKMKTYGENMYAWFLCVLKRVELLIINQLHYFIDNLINSIIKPTRVMMLSRCILIELIFVPKSSCLYCSEQVFSQVFWLREFG